MTPIATMDACELLDADHMAVKHLFVEYARLAVTGGERLAIARRICEELTVHAQIEEEIFYPALREAINAPELLDEAEAEHQEARDLIARIEALAQEGEEMDQLVQQLATAIERHVKMERDFLFAKARSTPGLDLEGLAQQLKERQAEVA